MRNIWLYIFFCLPILLFVLPHYASASSAYDDWKSGNYQSALKKFKPKAKDGDVFSQAMLGLMYKEGQGVKKDYKQAVKWSVMAAEKEIGIGSAYRLGVMYEKGGYGVEREYAKAVEYFLKVADQRHLAEQTPAKIYVMRRLGIYYSEGVGVQQDHKQALKWFTYAAQQGDAKSQARLGALYMQGLGISRNPAAAYKWVEMSAGGLNENIRKIIPGMLKELNVKGFLKARAKWREKFPPHLKPFGIVLGKRFPAELNYDLKDTFYKNDNLLINTYVNVKPPHMFSGKADFAKVRQSYSIMTTKTSDTVYKVSVKLDFSSESQCREALSAYYQNGPGSGTDPVIVTNWSSPSDYTGEFYQSQLFVADFTVQVLPGNPEHPLKLHDADNFSGVRLILSCQDKGGEIIFVHFPSVEKRIAESIEVTDWWNDFYEGKDMPDYMNPFGIGLGRPLPTAQRQSDGGDDVRLKIFTVSPPRPHKLFSQYIVWTSRLTNSVIKVVAEGRFDSKDQCNRILVVSAKELVMKYSTQDTVKEALNDIEPTDIPWNLSRLTLTPDDIYFDSFKSAEKTSIYTTKGDQSVPDSARAKHLVNISLGCGSAPDGKYWDGFIEYEHPLSEVIAKKEQDALNLYDF